MARTDCARRWSKSGQGKRTSANERYSSTRKLRTDLAAARFFRPVHARNAGRGGKEALTTCMRLRAFLATAMFVGVFGLTTAAWALNATDGQTPFNNEGTFDNYGDRKALVP